MTSLPRALTGSDPGIARPMLTEIAIGDPGEKDLDKKDEQFLLRAFRSFAETAASLEQSYGALKAEVDRLRQELAASNSDLARSAKQNRAMRIHLDRILERLPCGVLVVEGDGRISRANPEARHLVESGTRDAISSVGDLLPELRKLLDRSRNEGEPESSVHAMDGSLRWLAARHAAIGGESGNESIFILQDVTERKRLEEVQARLRRDQALAEVSALLAHEIRNPLGSLELFAGLLAESETDQERRGWIEHVQAGLRTLSATVNNVLHFHRTPEIERVPLDLGGLLEWARDFFLPLARQSQITLSLQNGLAGVRFPADRHRIEQVLLNLVLNSVRAMPRGGWIELQGRKIPDEGLEIVVSDTGPGIPVADLPHIFEPRFTHYSGSPGLGLAVCRKVVEQHGGTICAANRAGGGATFVMRFPRRCESAQEVTS